MNIIIPLGGKGERFSKTGYTQPKPLIKVFEKTMIEYVLDNLNITASDKVFIIYNSSLNTYNFKNYLTIKYPDIIFIEINDTRGAAETLKLGLEHILEASNNAYINKSLILDCDTFYTTDICNIFRNSSDTDNIVFYTKNYEPGPVYSYIHVGEPESGEEGNFLNITDIKEKEKISDNANTGAYAFADINKLYEYCGYVVDNDIRFNGEYYTSCVISEMINRGEPFKGYRLPETQVFSLGTPTALNNYIENTYAFLFDLDGTLVKTDDIYFDVWSNILSNYNISLTREMFVDYIQGNNDKYVLNNLLVNVDLELNELSDMKDDLFIENLNKIVVIEGIHEAVLHLKERGHKLAVVTNCNEKVAIQILKHINLYNLFDFRVTANDCKIGKPSSEPYQLALNCYNISPNKTIIFEDSKTGILSGKGISPMMLIGIETNYTREELIKSGVNHTLKNYLDFDLDKLLMFNYDSMLDIIDIITEQMIIKNVTKIVVDKSKLKGGFIATVISFTVVTPNWIFPLILKYETEAKTNLSGMAKQIKLYEREYYFYSDISDMVMLYIKVPKFYNLLTDDTGRHFGIVLENLLEKNYKINLNLNTTSIDVTLKIVDRMAKLHSGFWNKNLKALFPQLKTSSDEIFCPFFSHFIAERYELFKKKWSKTLNNSQIKLADEIFGNFSDIQARFSRGTNLTFIHGDIKSPNIFYDVESDYEPYFIDWQHCAIGKGVQDLVFFVIESFDCSNLKLIFNLTKTYYYKKLIEYGVINYSFQDYESDIYDAMCYIPFFTSIWFGTTPQDELIDKNFPYFFISKLFYLIEYVNNK